MGDDSAGDYMAALVNAARIYGQAQLMALEQGLIPDLSDTTAVEAWLQAP